jgi:DNA invertase Pin-like site-specific DNA recombinase
MKAIGYIRVSTEEQVRGGVSLDMQRSKIEAYTSLEEMELVEIIADEGLSGCSIKGRPGVQKVLQMVRERRVDAVIIYKLDRLARNTAEALDIARLLDRKGVALHSITEKLDTQSAVGRFFFTLMASLAEMERELIGERIRAAMQRKREKGESCSGNAPYGFQICDGMLVSDEEERAVIERIRFLRGEGRTVHQIAATLNDDGVRNRENRPFGKSQVHVLVQRHAA